MVRKLFPSVLKRAGQYTLLDHLRMKSRHSFIGPRNAQIISLNNALFWVWLLDYMERLKNLIELSGNPWVCAMINSLLELTQVILCLGRKEDLCWIHISYILLEKRAFADDCNTGQKVFYWGPPSFSGHSQFPPLLLHDYTSIYSQCLNRHSLIGRHLRYSVAKWNDMTYLGRSFKFDPKIVDLEWPS